MGTRAFVTSLSNGKGKEEKDEDDEDPKTLMASIVDAIDNDQWLNAEQKLLAKLFTKVRAFIAKVRYCVYSFIRFSYHVLLLMGRYGALQLQKSISDLALR